MPAQRMRSVIPPYMLRALLTRYAPQRDCALHTLNHVQSLLGNKPLRSPTEKNARAGERSAISTTPERHPTARQTGAQGGAAQQPRRAVDEAYDHLGVTYDFFWQAYRRNSVDNKGLPLVQRALRQGLPEQLSGTASRWCSETATARSSTVSPSPSTLVGHELTHGSDRERSRLIYYQQSGALNESLSDVFGSLVKQFHLQQTADKADWLIGAGLLAKGIKGKGLRSMSAPGTAYDDPLLGKDPQPASMKDYIQTKEDNGGVHLNSGIPNRAFYLAATVLGGFAGKKPVTSGMTRCATKRCRKTPTSDHLRPRHGETRAGLRTKRGDKVQQAWASGWQWSNETAADAQSGYGH
uniref:Extracellular minor metalloprotease n=1 Tax=Serratia marcescens (strain ATCC 21074 / E-15) TaxID=617 RepID=SMP_SERME|nr:RecName: Full=Extracellular minor metalloprotease; Flags: Precursor [Serratia sp. E-15]AAA26553.1 extracellular protease [Serratia marcescens]